MLLSEELAYQLDTWVPGKFVDIVSQDPSDSKSSRLHVDIIFRICFHSFVVYSSIDFSKTIGNSPEVSTFKWLFLKLNQFICNWFSWGLELQLIISQTQPVHL